ncbi:phosphatidylethanolamine-binding protein 4 isoform X2 [Kryptolebias marmoratus]|uniref:phosphatidylethanolamine-binding protein 4 isoform X2 n=1 Tax=Kryptolebias marmoratus TaxID=37003 RepID=UPI0007F8D1D0|nr:phosphatidylethanolamine-binding protein 4 isoform X2 [Kryptolebias marmoratus]
MAVLAPFLVIFAFILELPNVETTQRTLDSLDASFCHAGLEVIYPDLDIDKCLIVSKELKLREKISTVWKAPQIYFSGARKDNALKKGNIQGKTLTDYHPPMPPPKTGFHRYQFMLFEQPPGTSVSLTDQEKSRGKWDLQAFITRFGLGTPVSTVQFLTQNFKD